MLSPEQIEWHEKVRNALNAEVRNPNFILRIDVEPGAADDEPQVELDELPREVNRWLADLDPDDFPDPAPERAWRYDDVLIEVGVGAKYEGSREWRGEIVLNPFPAFAYFPGELGAG